MSDSMEAKSCTLPPTMAAIQVTAYGDPSSTFIFNPSVPTPSITSPDDVLIRVHSTAINPGDYHTARGSLTVMKKVDFPYIPCQDIGGEVIAVGANVKNVKVGDRVYGSLGQDGRTMANYCVGKSYLLSPIPSSLSYSYAAAIPVPTLTSYQVLFVHGAFKAGQRLLVIGGSSATGQAAIQLAKAAGGWVAATTSTRNIDLVRGLGADFVIDYTTQRWEEVLKDQEKFNIVYDTVGEENAWEKGSGLVKKEGIFLQISLSGDPKMTFAKLMALGLGIIGKKISTLFGGSRYNFCVLDISEKSNVGKQLEIINQWINEGKYRLIIDKVFPFTKEGAIDLFHTSESRKARGKLVVEIIPPDTPTPTLSSPSIVSS